ncbi:hypothetical protein M3P21_20885 [Ruegeria sp. 2012CJ41-6]|uniref:Uncharacterized protein n=1 Tax=Ruegeria spongiae TaxID=2942209 RepID=A0ABT0Q7Y0_9RHOB|nr:hypothetical protein [Ruegeria spongiae]MCL6285976.1 hypothetical protein [Ruegeria spongiae]
MESVKTSHDKAKFLNRNDIRELKRASRLGDGEAALRLLEHSVKCGHTRLALIRFFVALELNVDGAMRHAKYFKGVCESLTTQQLSEIRKNAASQFGCKKSTTTKGTCSTDEVSGSEIGSVVEVAP